MRRGRRQADGAGPISTGNSAAASITAITCCSSGNRGGLRLSRPDRRARDDARSRRAAVSLSWMSDRRALECTPQRRTFPVVDLHIRAAGCPGTKPRDYLALLGARAVSKPAATVAGALRPGTLYTRLIEPLAIAALNTRPEQGSASLLAAVVNETLAQGGAACVPAVPARRTFGEPRRSRSRLIYRRGACACCSASE